MNLSSYNLVLKVFPNQLEERPWEPGLQSEGC